MRYFMIISPILLAIFPLFAIRAYPQTDSIPFSLPLNYSSGETYHSICIEDLDNDDDYDVAAGRQDSIAIFINDGNGILLLHSVYGIPYGDSRSICASDFDADEDIDLAATCDLGAMIYLNDGDGMYQPPIFIQIDGNAAPESITSSDLNGDGAFDLAVSCELTNNVFILLNNGEGNFQIAGNFPVGDGPDCVIAVDLDGDFDNDMVTANAHSDNITILYNSGDATFDSAIAYAFGTTPVSICAADFNRDGDYDIAAANFSSNDVSILENDGNGQFQLAANINVVFHPRSICAADLDCDDDLDIAVTNDDSMRLLSILNNYGDGSFQSPVNYSTLVGGESAVSSADLDADNDNDLAASGAHALIILHNQSIIAGIGMEGELSLQRVTSHTPVFKWYYRQSVAQNQFEIEIGADTDWYSAELWNPPIFVSADTFVTYDGGILIDGNTYYYRLRTNCDDSWTQWLNSTFRMNSMPSKPVLLSPINGEVVESATPTLYLQNSTDAESDPLTYDYFVFDDSEYVYAEVSGVEEQADSTGWTVDIPMIDNKPYMWTVRANDGYEYSEWSLVEWFWVNSTEDYPTAFDLTYPPDTGWSQVYDILTEFRWHQSYDPDPKDSVYYRLKVALDSNFTFSATYDSIYSKTYVVSSLEYNKHYWWKAYAIDTKGNMTQSSGVADFMTWILGDANADFVVNVADAVFFINYIFKGGAAPDPLKIGDINGDCQVHIGDAVYLISYIFKGGDPPQVGCAGTLPSP